MRRAVNFQTNCSNTFYKIDFSGRIRMSGHMALKGKDGH